MGMSADATIAWGVVLDTEDEGELRDAIEELLEHDWDLRDLFGFTEEFPRLMYAADRTPEYEAALEAWRQREAAAVPVEFGHYGSYDYGGRVLFIKRTYTNVNWGCEAVDPATVRTPFSQRDRDALNKVLDAIGFKGDRTVKLLLWAMYG